MTKNNKQILPLTHGICHLSCIPLRSKPEDFSEMVSQILFGETFEIVSKKNKNWIKVITDYDHYVGWIDPKQVTQISVKDRDKYINNYGVALDNFSGVSTKDGTLIVTIGSNLPLYDGMSFILPSGKCIFNGHAIMTEDRKPTADLLIKIARKYINAPYLWGGRSILGLDCSGFTQVVFKLLGIWLPRDAYQQAEIGEIIDFVELSKGGDLAFFVNKDEKIHHVGIILETGEIIHASGQVRIDRLDHEGIFNVTTKKYTHKLKFIRRIIR